MLVSLRVLRVKVKNPCNRQFQNAVKLRRPP